MKLLFILCSLLIVNSRADGSTTKTVPKCTFPNERISILNVTGTIPFGAAGLVNVPYGTRCTFEFDVPPGFALRIETTARGTYEQIEMNHKRFNLPVQNHEEYSVDKNVSYLFYSWSRNYTLFARWSYVDLSQFTQKVVPTGNYFNLQLDPLTYYTVQAAQNDQVAFTISDLYSYVSMPYDYTRNNVFVYDGNDVLKSTYLGRADRVYFGKNQTFSGTSKFHSTGNTLTFLNLYGQPTITYLMAYDWKKMDPQADYFTFTISQNFGGDSILQNPFQNVDAYYTMICPDCYYNQVYITKLDFYDYKNETTDRFVEIQGRTPTHQMPFLIKYPYSTNTSANFPQLIYSNVVTFHTHRANLYYTLKSTYGNWPGYSDWLKVGDGAQRRIISPHLWHPANPIASMGKRVSNDGDSMVYTLVVDDFEKNGNDSTYLEVRGYSNGVLVSNSDQRFNKTLKSQTLNVTCNLLQIQLTDPTNTSTIIAHVGVRKADQSGAAVGFNVLFILMTVIGCSL